MSQKEPNSRVKTDRAAITGEPPTGMGLGEHFPVVPILPIPGRAYADWELYAGLGGTLPALYMFSSSFSTWVWLVRPRSRIVEIPDVKSCKLP